MYEDKISSCSNGSNIINSTYSLNFFLFTSLTFLNITNEAEDLGNSTEEKARINQIQKEDKKSATKDGNTTV